MCNLRSSFSSVFLFVTNDGNHGHILVFLVFDVDLLFDDVHEMALLLEFLVEGGFSIRLDHLPKVFVVRLHLML